MCGRYFIEAEGNAEVLAQALAEARRKLGAEDGAPDLKTGEIRPSDLVPVIANNRRLEPTAFAMKWGYQKPEGKGLIINARSETAADKAMFRDSMRNRRCLIPASHYFEWEHRGKEKRKYAIGPQGEEALYMAGIYRLEGNGPAFVILTREAAPDIAFLHDRMPVILPEGAAKAWLDARNPAEEVLRAALLDLIYVAAQPQAEAEASLDDKT